MKDRILPTLLILAAAASFLLTWLSFFNAGLLSLIPWLPGFGLVLARSRKLAPWFALASPFIAAPVLNALLGGAGYFLGTARFQTVGMPGPEFNDLDPDYRVRWSTSGCLVNGAELLYQTPHNVVVMALVRSFGPMRGVYDGPYPTREEARAAIEVFGALASREELAGGVLVSPGRRVQLTAEVLERLEDPRLRTGIAEPTDTWRAVVLDELLVLERVDGPESGAALVLVTLGRQEVIARYVSRGTRT